MVVIDAPASYNEGLSTDPSVLVDVIRQQYVKRTWQVSCQDELTINAFAHVII